MGARGRSKHPDSSEDQTTPVAKSAKTGKTLVLAAILKAAHLPPSVREMLSVMAPTCLDASKGQRSSSQAQVVDMIEETLAAVQAGMEHELLEAETTLNDAAAEVEQLRPIVCAAEADLKDRSALVSMWDDVLQQDKYAFESAKGVMETAEQNRMGASQKIDRVEQTKAMLKTAMVENYAPLRKGLLAPMEVKQCEQTICSVIDNLGLEQTLQQVLPLVIAKPSESCSPFETVVLEKFETEVSKRVADLTEEAERLVLEKVGHDNVVSELAAGLREVQEKHEVSVWALEQATIEQENSQTAVETARRELNSAVMKLAAVDVCEARRKKLIAFQEGPLTAFRTLKERSVLLNLPDELSQIDIDTSTLPEPALPEAVSSDMCVQPAETLVQNGIVNTSTNSEGSVNNVTCNLREHIDSPHLRQGPGKDADASLLFESANGDVSV